MNITESKSIFQQIAERIQDEILNGIHQPDARIPSVREYAALVEVNANTVMRSYDLLQTQGIIYNKRGIGYFVAPDAALTIRRLRRENFLHSEADYFFSRLRLLNITAEELANMYQDYLKNNTPQS